MSKKHVINEPRELVNEALKGLVRSNPSLMLDKEDRVVHLKDIKQDRVALISGGGSGHEPAHAGYVGPGLLSAAACGNVFASPNVGQIRKALSRVENSKGVLMVIMRYTGDVLQFGLAKEQHSVRSPQTPLHLCIVGDDCAVPRSQGTIVGRRGLAGTILVYKLASALADERADLKDCAAIAEWAKDRVGTIGIGLEHCHVPGTAVGTEESHLKADEVEIGMGIHNEPGVLKEKLTKSSELVRKMLRYITDVEDEERGFVPFKLDGGDEVILMVNNLGGMSELEMSAIANEAVEALTSGDHPIAVRRMMVGSFMTSLNLPGFSLSLLLLPRDGEAYSSDRILELFDAPASAPGWKTASTDVGVTFSPNEVKAEGSDPIKDISKAVPHADFELFSNAVKSAAERVIAAEPEITRFDTIAGDGDCGTCLKAGAEGLLQLLKSGKLDNQNMVGAVLDMAAVVEKEMDGTSGALYSIYFNALAAGLQNASDKAGPTLWATALSHALDTLYQYTSARRPSRTLVDSLSAFTESYASTQDLDGSVREAQKAADATRDQVAKAGRAAYVGREELQKAQVPDPGAWGVVKILEGLQEALQ